MATLDVSFTTEFGIGADILAMIQKNFDRPESDVRPWETVAIVPDQAPLFEGRPIDPPMWVRTTPFITMDGSAISGGRKEPTELVMDADALWLPYENSWDSTTGTWRPWIATAPRFAWVQPTVNDRPIFTAVNYRLGKEIITVPVMRFTTGQNLISDFFTGAQAVNFTVSFVVWLSGMATGPYALLDWNGTAPFPDTRTFIYIDEKVHYGWGNKTSWVDPIAPLASLRPVFLTLVISPPEARLYVSTGPRNTYSTVFPVDATMGLSGTSLQFLLGRSYDPDITGLNNFSLMAAALWSRPLNNGEVTTLNANYASVWGASNEWG